MSHAPFSLLWKRLYFSNPHPENMFSNPFSADFFKDTLQFITLQAFYTLTTTHKCKPVFTQILCAWILFDFFSIGTWSGPQCLLRDTVFCIARIYISISFKGPFFPRKLRELSTCMREGGRKEVPLLCSSNSRVWSSNRISLLFARCKICTWFYCFYSIEAKQVLASKHLHFS